MNAAEIISLRDRSPFMPFEIRLKDGESVRVKHAYEIATGPNSPSCVVYEGEDQIRFVAYRDVVEVVTASVNGS